MVSSSRNIPSRGGTAVSSVVGAVAKVSNLRSATSSRTLYMHVHNSIRDDTLGASLGWPNNSRLTDLPTHPEAPHARLWPRSSIRFLPRSHDRQPGTHCR